MWKPLGCPDEGSKNGQERWGGGGGRGPGRCIEGMHLGREVVTL